MITKTDLDLLELETLRERLVYLDKRLGPDGGPISSQVAAELEEERSNTEARVIELEGYHVYK